MISLNIALILTLFTTVLANNETVWLRDQYSESKEGDADHGDDQILDERVSVSFNPSGFAADHPFSKKTCYGQTEYDGEFLSVLLYCTEPISLSVELDTDSQDTDSPKRAVLQVSRTKSVYPFLQYVIGRIKMPCKRTFLHYKFVNSSKGNMLLLPWQLACRACYNTDNLKSALDMYAHTNNITTVEARDWNMQYKILSHGKSSVINGRSCSCWNGNLKCRGCGTRPNWNSLSPSDRVNYVKNLNLVNYIWYEEMHNIMQGHSTEAGFMHGGATFGPGHENYLRRYEQALQRIDATRFLPFFAEQLDSTNSASQWSFWDSSSIGGPGSFPTAYGIYNTTHAPFPVTSPWASAYRSPSFNSNSAPSFSDISSLLSIPTFSIFNQQLEGWVHVYLHISVSGWVGSIPLAAFDPIFWMHHAFIDRIFCLWKQLHPVEWEVVKAVRATELISNLFGEASTSSWSFPSSSQQQTAFFGTYEDNLYGNSDDYYNPTKCTCEYAPIFTIVVTPFPLVFNNMERVFALTGQTLLARLAIEQEDCFQAEFSPEEEKRLDTWLSFDPRRTYLNDMLQIASRENIEITRCRQQKLMNMNSMKSSLTVQLLTGRSQQLVQFAADTGARLDTNSLVDLVEKEATRPYYRVQAYSEEQYESYFGDYAGPTCGSIRERFQDTCTKPENRIASSLSPVMSGV